MTTEQLDEFSSNFRDLLFSAYPDWLPLMQIGHAANSELGHLIVEVPPPVSSNLASGLSIQTDGNEVTVGFDHVHQHFVSEEVTHRYQEALEFIAAILSEEVVALSEWLDCEWVSSWCISPEELEAPINSTPSSTSIRIRSWTGTYDRDIAAV